MLPGEQHTTNLPILQCVFLVVSKTQITAHDRFKSRVVFSLMCGFIAKFSSKSH